MKQLLSLLQRFGFIIGLVLCVPVLFGYFQPHFFHLHDFTHVARLAELERGIHDGQLPVRWSQNLGYGYGMPQFSFYGPLFYYEAYLFRLTGLSYVWAIKCAAILQVVVSFVAFYWLGNSLWGKPAGFLVSLAGIYSPYRLVDMYVRGAFAELSGMTMVLLTFCAIYYWAQKPTWRRTAYISLAGAGIILSHTLMAIISALFVVIWLGYWIVKRSLFTKWSHVLVVGLLVMGLSAWFALPAFFEKGLTQADQLTQGFSNYNYHFLYIRQFWHSVWEYGGSVWGIEDDISFELGKVQILVVALVFCFICWAFWKRRRPTSMSTMVVLYVLIGISLFLSVLKSKPLWDAMPLLAFIQFPWRFLSVASLFIPILCGAIVLGLPKKISYFVVVVGGLLCLSTQLGHLHPESYLTDDDALYYSDPASIQTKMSDIIPDFLPKTASVAGLIYPITASDRFTSSPTIKATIEVARSNSFLLNLPSHEATQLTISIFDFPGWKLYLNGTEVPHEKTLNGLITLPLSKTLDTSYVSGIFAETRIRLLADIASLIALIGTFTLLYLPSDTKKEQHES
jgi:hypothetical protein